MSIKFEITEERGCLQRLNGIMKKDWFGRYYNHVRYVYLSFHKKTLDLPDASKVEFGHVHGNAITTVYE